MAAKERHPVAQGGLWSAPKASYSKETQQLLKQMMQESKLTNFQQRQLSKTVDGGSTLPLNCNPTSSAKPRQPGSSKSRPASKKINPRTHNPQIRTKDTIESSGAYERDQYVPGPASFYDEEKERFVNVMAFGEDIAPPEPQKFVRRQEVEEPPDIDRFEELQSEIEERRSFLADMESLGQGKKFRPIIATEVSQLIREMEVIDLKKTAELKRIIEAEDKKKQAAEGTGIPPP